MSDTFRVTSYELKDDASGFTGTTFALTLQQDLADDYFVLIDPQGAYDGSTNSGPNKSVCQVTKDPNGTGDLAASAAADQIELGRNSSTDTWVGVITVVECLGDQGASGFTLLHVDNPSFATTDSTLSTVLLAGQEWTDINQVVPFGGLMGGGCATSLASAANWHAIAFRIWPKLTGAVQSIEYARDLTSGNGAAQCTTFLIEWGSEWNIERASPSGTNGGNGVNATGEYNTATVASAVRGDTWVWGCGTTADNGLGDGAHGAVFTLGDGVTQNASETKVALGLEYIDQKDFELYVLTHADAIVDYRFGTDGGTGIPSAGASGTMTVDAKNGAESYGSVSTYLEYTKGYRIPLLTNTMGGNGNQYPAVNISARHTASTTLTWDRLGSGLPGAVWLQSIDLSAILFGTTIAPGGAASYAATGVAPAVNKVLSVTPSAAASMSAAGVAPTVPRVHSIAPGGAASAAATGVAPTVPRVHSIAPIAAASVSATGVVPTVPRVHSIAPGAAASASSAGVSPSISRSLVIAPSGAASVGATGVSPTVPRVHTVTPSAAAAVASSALGPAIARTKTITGSSPALAYLTPLSPAVPRIKTVAAGAGPSLAVTGASPAVGRAISHSPSSAASAAASAVSPAVGKVVTYAPGGAASVAATGLDPTVPRALSIAPGVAPSIAASALSPAVTIGRILNPATVTISVSAVAPAVVRVLEIAPGGVASTSISAASPAVLQELNVEPSGWPKATYSALSPSVSRTQVIAPGGAATASLTGVSPPVLHSRVFAPGGAASAAATAVSPAVDLDPRIRPGGAAGVSASAVSPTVTKVLSVVPGVAVALFKAKADPGVPRTHSIAVTAPSVAASAISPAVTRAHPVAAGPSTLTATALAPSIQRVKSVSPGVALFSSNAVTPAVRTGGSTFRALTAILSVQVRPGWTIGPRDVVEVQVERVAQIQFREQHSSGFESLPLLASSAQFTEAILTQAAFTAALVPSLLKKLER